MFILTDSDGVLVAIGNEVVEDKHEQGVVWINGAGYGLDGQQIYEVDNIPEYVVPNKYKYVDGEFIINENYKPYVDVETLVEQQSSTISNLSNQMDLLEGTIAELMTILGGMQ
jgi:hypothetical protein